MLSALFRSGLLAAAASWLATTSGAVQQQWQQLSGQLQQTPASPEQTQALAATIQQWKTLQQGGPIAFDSFATFLLAHPGWPSEIAMRRAAERALDLGSASPSLIVSYFRRFPPLSTSGTLRFAEALSATGDRDGAVEQARAAWRRGSMSSSDEGRLLQSFGASLTPDDHDARMDALLWQGATSSAQRQLGLTSPARQPLFAARLSFRSNGPDAATLATTDNAAFLSDAGYLADRAIWLRNNNTWPAARALLARPHAVTTRPGDVEKWFELLVSNARGAANDGQSSLAYAIASQVDDAYPAGTDVSQRPYGERDEYTNLTWLAGQTALKSLARPADAMGMFERYANASQTPGTRAKGLYWAGRAADAAAKPDLARAFYEKAAQLPDQYYGQLSTERLGRPLMPPADAAAPAIDPGLRTAFYNSEVVRAARYLGTIGAHVDQTAFVRQIAIDAKTEADHALAIEFSRAIARPDLGVMVGRSAVKNGLTDYAATGFPRVPVPEGQADAWTMIHAIARQESQFDRAAISRAGARGLMQLMPGTASDTARKLGLAFSRDALTDDPSYNIQLGSAYFQKLYAYYGSYPLAVAAYNAGPGNVNKWLAANGDPRTGTIDPIDWIEAIPIYETRNYVQRVLENAVVYDLLNPQHSRSTGNARLSWYLGRKPG